MQVQQTARRGHEDIQAFFDAADLGLHAYAAKDHGGSHVQVLAVIAHRFFHLGCQLTGGAQHQGANHAGSRGRPAVEQVQHRQRKGGRLAGAGLGAAEQVTAFKNQRNGLLLDGGGGGVADLVHGFDDGRSQS